MPIDAQTESSVVPRSFRRLSQPFLGQVGGNRPVAAMRVSYWRRSSATDVAQHDGISG